MPAINKIKTKRDSEYITGTNGYVYAIKSIHGVKIGCSIEPDKRAKTIDSSVPFATSIIAIIPCADMYLIENQLHRIFSDKRIKGEWFLLNEDDLSSIINMIPDGFIYLGRSEQKDGIPF